MRLRANGSLLLLMTLMTSHPVMAEGWYAGLNLGMGVANLRTPNGTDRDSQTVLGALVGYQANPYWALEAQYTGIGEATDNLAGSVKADALSLTVVGSLPINDSFKLLAKVGVANTQTTVSSPLTGVRDARRTASSIGLGAEYAFDSAISMRVGWDYYGAQVDTATGSKDFGTYVSSVGVVYRF